MIRMAVNTDVRTPMNRVQAKPFTGPEPNSRCNSVGPYFTEPQKAPLLLLTDRPVQLETPRHYFLTPFTPNEAFYVRWHLEGIPNAVDLKEWKLRIEGDVKKPIALSMSDLIQKFKPISIAAVNQCSGNSRSRDGLSKIPAGMSVTLRGIAFSGFGGVVCARKFQTMEERPGPRRLWAKTMARTPFAPGRCRGPRSRQAVILWRCALPTKKIIPSPTNLSGIPVVICGIASNGRKWLWEMRADGERTRQADLAQFSW